MHSRKIGDSEVLWSQRELWDVLGTVMVQRSVEYWERYRQMNRGGVAMKTTGTLCVFTVQEAALERLHGFPNTAYWNPNPEEAKSIYFFQYWFPLVPACFSLDELPIFHRCNQICLEPWALTEKSVFSKVWIKQRRCSSTTLCWTGQEEFCNVTKKSAVLISVWLICEVSQCVGWTVGPEKAVNQGAGCTFRREDVTKSQVMKRALNFKLHQNSSLLVPTVVRNFSSILCKLQKMELDDMLSLILFLF